MVDFKKHLSGKKSLTITDPIPLYETLDRAHDKGPLRPAQAAVLGEWYGKHRNDKEVIIKLHTGQGKTLVGLLLLQSKLNEKHLPVLYLCPDNHLISQTCEQARQFGIATCIADPDIPSEFLDGKKILITSVQKLFNGLTKFGLYNRAISIDTLLMDDAHTCSDRIRESCRIRITHDEQAYKDLLTLFERELEQQGAGTFADLCNGKFDAYLPIPYWSWIEKESDVAKILSSKSDQKSIKFAWPILRDMLANCQCIISGSAIEIEPYIPPLEAIGSYWNAPHRVFMSATVTDDSFLVKGLQISPNTIINPLTFDKERWSGEKMILIPSLIHEILNREYIVSGFAKPSEKRTFGVVALAPSFKGTKDWEGYGSVVADKSNIGNVLDRLLKGNYSQTVVLANRYDGIDLPDSACRILIFDGRPYSESLIDLYQESCRPESESTYVRTIRTVEQGFGRSVRGEKDYSVIIVIGTDLTRLVRDSNSRKYLSSQMATQIEIGLQLAEMAKTEIEDGETPTVALMGLINQALRRDLDWKTFYAEKMDNVIATKSNDRILQIYLTELHAERANLKNDYALATAIIQKMLDKYELDSSDKAWYLQEMARYTYKARRPDSQKYQLEAFNGNRMLLRPPEGVTVSKIAVVSHGRMERIKAWVVKFTSYEQLSIRISDICGNLVFGGKAEKFEQALDELGLALGFACARPDKEWKEGPDNLWALDDMNYIVWECKNEVEITRQEINKRETEQMNRSHAWFCKHYVGLQSKNLMIHPTNKIASAASFLSDVEIMRNVELNKFIKRINSFFKAFESMNFNDLSSSQIQNLIDAHHLSIDDILHNFSKKPKNIC